MLLSPRRPRPGRKIRRQRRALIESLEQRQQALTAATAMYEREPDGDSAETLAMAAAANGHFQDAVDLQAQAMFEALRIGDQNQLAWLRENMTRYEAGQPANAAWPQTAEVFRPRSLHASAPAGS